MNIQKAQGIAVLLMAKHGLIEKGWKFSFDHAIRRFGCCNYGTKTISLSRSLVELNEIDQVKNTILHEIAHALVGKGHGHDRIWKRKAIEIGCTGERCYSSESVVTPELRYTLKCPTCGYSIKRARKPRNNLACGICCAGTYNKKHQFIVLEA